MRIDLRELKLHKDVYRDFEGFADAKEVLLKCRSRHIVKIGPAYRDGVVVDETVQTIDYGEVFAWDMMCDEDDPPELRKAVRSITLNLMYETADTAGIEHVTFEVACATAYAIKETLTVPGWVEVTDEEIKTMLEG